MQISTLNEIIFIDSISFAASYYKRATDTTWRFDLLDKTEDALTIEAIGLTLPLSELFIKM
jgi:hypothetical protein